MNDLTSIEKDLEALNDKIEVFTSNLKFEEIGKFKLSESEKFTNDLEKSLKSKGIYYLEIQNTEEIKNLEKWKDDFLKNWENDKTNKSREAALKSIKEAEYMARFWPRLRKYSKGEVRSGLSIIKIPVYDMTGEIIDYHMVLSESTEMFKHLIQRNSHQFAHVCR